MEESPEETARTLGRAELQDRAVSGAAWTMLHTVVSVPIAFLVNLLLARLLEPAGYGRLAYLTTVIGIAGSVLALGLTPAMIQFGAKAHAAGRTNEVRGILSSSQGFRLLVVAPALTVIVLLVVDVPITLLALAVAFGVWVPAALDGAPITLFIENKTAAGARVAMLSNILVQTAVVVAVLWLGTADAVWAARIVIGGAGIALALPSISSSYRRAVLRPRLPRNWPTGFWKFAVPTGIAGLVGQLALSRTEVLYLTWLSTPEAAGLYALAFGLAGHIFAPAQALTGPLMPAISGLREVDPSRVRGAFVRTLRATATIIALLTAAALPALVIVLPTLYGAEFASAAPAALTMGIVGALVMATGPVSAFVLARLSGRTYLRANVIALFVNIALAFATIPALGMWGAVIANGAAALTRMVVLLRSEQLALSLSVRDILDSLTPAAVGGLACILGWAPSLILRAPVLVEAAIATLMASLALIIGLRFTGSGMETGDLDAISRIIPARLRRPVDAILRVVSIR